MSCECDIHVFPRPLIIPAGSTTLARQLGAFPEWRQAVLAAIGRESVLDAWNSREPQHLGLMLVDFWAYVCDVISFYDGAVAAEVYLRTAALRPSRRKLVGLLGYVPRPAVGATAYLAATAEGRKTIVVPSGTQFRSTGFDGNPPQVFELGAETTVHPLNNKWPIARVVPTQLNPLVSTVAVDGFLIVPATLRALPGDKLAVLAGATALVRSVLRIEQVTTLARERFARIVLSSSVSLPGLTTYASVDLRKPSTRAGVWTGGTATGEVAAIGTNALVLDGLHRGLAAEQKVIVTAAGTDTVMTVSTVEEQSRVLLTGLESQLKNAAGTLVTARIVSPDIKVQVTKVTFTSNLPAGAIASTTSVWYAMASAGRVVSQPLDTLSPLDPIRIDGVVETPPIAPGALMLLDVNGAGVKASVQVDFTTNAVTLASDATWAPPLSAPVTMFGNTLTVTRGEAVHNETLGIGNASQSLQTFKLAKKPLTYLPGDQGGPASTLEIHVDGIRWEETPSFFTATPQSRVFIVRADDEENTLVTFGGGARLATGSVVLANYRFGAGVACPPSGTITQLARPIKGLKSVNNPLDAFGGADREGSEELLAYAPRSALLLGRAISLVDFEAAAASVAGVRAVAAEWRFSSVAQRPLVHIYFIGDAQLRSTVFQQLRDLSDPTVPLIVEAATADLRRIDLSITVSPDYESSMVLNAVRDRLFAAATTPGTGGLLRPERLGVGRALFESQISEAVVGVEGVQSLDWIVIDWVLFAYYGYGIKPAAGHYLDFETGGVVINGKAGYV